MSTTRRKFSKEFKSKVVLESLKERETLESLAKKYELTPTQISVWRSLALKNFGNVFSSESSEDKDGDIDRQILYAQIGELKVQNEFLKKTVLRGPCERKNMVEPNHNELRISTQIELLSIPRSSFYYVPIGESEQNLEIMRLLDEQYMTTPFYGILRLTTLLQLAGYPVNVKRIRRLMKLVNWQTIFREAKTTVSKKTHYKYPYLLRNLKRIKCNQVWAMDITYIPMKKGFMYLTAIIDLHSRYVIHWPLSNTMTAEWCAVVLKAAIERHGMPEIFNTDLGSQFTSDIFINEQKKNDINISMDGKGLLWTIYSLKDYGEA